MTSFPRPFPIEIEENIMDHLSGRPPTLLNCTLTCRRWLPRARFRLLSAVCIKSRAGLASLCRFLESNPHCQAWIRSVTMAPSVEKEMLLLCGIFPIPLLSPRLPNLRRWDIRNGMTRISSQERSLCFNKATLIQLLYSSSSIEELSLKALRFLSAAEIVRLAGSFPKLCCLVWDNIGFNLKRSSLSAADALFARNHLPGLAAMDCSIGPDIIPLMHVIFDVVHPTLRDLTLRQPKDMDFASALPPSPSRPSLTQLRTLTLHTRHDTNVHLSPFDWLSLLSEACRTLHEFKCAPTLRTFAIHLRFGRVAHGPRRSRKSSQLDTVVSRSLRFLHDEARCVQLKRVLHEHTRLELFTVALHLPREEKRRWLVLKHLREQGFFALHWMGLLGVDGSSGFIVKPPPEPRDVMTSWSVDVISRRVEEQTPPP